MKDGGLNEEVRMTCLTKIASIAMYSSRCNHSEIFEACNYVDNCLLDSDDVDEKYKSLIKLSQLIRSL